MTTIYKYVRDHQPVCFEVDVFNNEHMLDVLPERLLTSGLTWYWQSVREKPLADSRAVRDVPSVRLSTRLTPDHVTLLLDDFREVDIDGDGRAIDLFGVDSNVGLSHLDGVHLRPALEAFLAREDGPIRIVIIQIHDTSQQYFFVPHDPIESVRILLASWGIDPSSPYKRRPYKHLYGAALEAQLESKVALANGKLKMPD